MSVERLQAEAERDFLLARLDPFGRYSGATSWVGISSNEMLTVAITGRRINGFNIPWDEGDLGRCEETYRRAPEHLKPRLLPILEGFRLMVRGLKETRPGTCTLEEATHWAECVIAQAAQNKAALTPTPPQPPADREIGS